MAGKRQRKKGEEKEQQEAAGQMASEEPEFQKAPNAEVNPSANAAGSGKKGGVSPAATGRGLTPSDYARLLMKAGGDVDLMDMMIRLNMISDPDFEKAVRSEAKKRTTATTKAYRQKQKDAAASADAEAEAAAKAAAEAAAAKAAAEAAEPPVDEVAELLRRQGVNASGGSGVDARARQAAEAYRRAGGTGENVDITVGDESGGAGDGGGGVQSSPELQSVVKSALSAYKLHPALIAANIAGTIVGEGAQAIGNMSAIKRNALARAMMEGAKVKPAMTSSEQIAKFGSFGNDSMAKAAAIGVDAHGRRNQEIGNAINRIIRGLLGGANAEANSLRTFQAGMSGMPTTELIRSIRSYKRAGDPFLSNSARGRHDLPHDTLF